MLSATLAPQAATHARSPLNVVFIIDTFLPPPPLGLDETKCQTEKAVALLKRSLVRTLLYFHCNMDPRFQWTYQFFNSRLYQDIGLIPNRVLRSLSTSTVATCIDEYRKIIDAEALQSSPPRKGSASATAKSIVSPCYNLRRQLVHSLADFGLDIASYQSPMKTSSSLVRSQSLQKHFPPVSIRNYMYIISPLPRTWTETVTFLEGKPPSQTDRVATAPWKNEIVDVIKGVRDAFFEQGLWDRFLDQRTSLSWIDTTPRSTSEEPIKPQSKSSATALIRTTLELTMKAFGGHIIPQHILCMALPPRDVYSFATIFQTHRSMLIHPGLGVRMSKDSWQELLSTPVSLNSEDVRPVKVTWSGNVLCAETSQYNEKPCEHALYLFKSLRTKNDALLLEVSFRRESHEPAVEQGDQDESPEPQMFTRQALLYSTITGSGIMVILQEDVDLMNLIFTVQAKRVKARPFSLAMMDKSLSKLGAFVDQVDNAGSTGPCYRVDDMPSSVLQFFKPPEAAPGPVAGTKSPASKPHPGESVDEMDAVIAGSGMAESIDDLCLDIRKTYLKYLYGNEHNVSDYVKRLNAASKEMTALAAKQSVPLKEAQQKLVAFIIEFLRIWPSRMESKYKQISKEVNVAKFSDSKSQDHYVILDDERSVLDTWKADVMRCVKDSDVRMHLRKLRIKDWQIQIVQNLHILLLINKYELEENKPFKRDLGALKTITQFMDELCISASIENHPEPGLMSPQTPRSKDMDSAKKFFTRIIARYYELSLPKVVEKLSIKCGVEKSLLSSPRPSRGSKQAGVRRSVSLGTLEKPTRPDFAAALAGDDGGEEGKSTKATVNGVGSKSKPSLVRRSTTDGPGKSLLNSAIFRNRQVVMTLGSVKGVGTTKSSSTGGASKHATKSMVASATKTTAARKQATVPTKPLPEMEDEDAPPALAKLRLKRFYHDKESQEMLKGFRRQQPLSKADAHTTNSQIITSSSTTTTTTTTKPEDKYVAEHVDYDNKEDGDEEDEDDEELGALSKYLRERGTTSWGVIKSVNVPSSRIMHSPSFNLSGTAPRSSSNSNSVSNGYSSRRTRSDASSSPSVRYTSMDSLTTLPLSDSVVPCTPTSKQGYLHLNGQNEDGYSETSTQKSPSTPTGRAQAQAQLRRHTTTGTDKPPQIVIEDLTELLPRFSSSSSSSSSHLSRRRSRESLEEDPWLDGRPTSRRREV
ncbi:hypothetical protein BGX31_008640 [Mortierella sp. GBA43]|nr:hypothetical protein BGX31_008640 [Mortierella sp. GBA43]